jgi:hypothetical protein
MKYLLTTLLCLSTSLSHGSEISFDDNLEDSFEILGGYSCLDGIFPTKITGEQISSFKLKGHIIEDVGTFSIDDKFTATLPYSFQILTGTDAKFARNISFTRDYVVKKNKLCGRYQFNSPYSLSCNSTFEIQLESDKVHNLLDSVLGEKDFIDGESSKPFRTLCISTPIPSKI